MSAEEGEHVYATVVKVSRGNKPENSTPEPSGHGNDEDISEYATIEVNNSSGAGPGTSGHGNDGDTSAYATIEVNKSSGAGDVEVIYDKLYPHDVSIDAGSETTVESKKEQQGWKIVIAGIGIFLVLVLVIVLPITIPGKKPVTSGPVRIKALKFDITLKNKIFNVNLMDPTTIQYTLLKVEVEGKLKSILMKTVPGFRSVTVIGFKKGSVIARVNVTTKDTEVTPEYVVRAYENSNSGEKEYFSSGLVAGDDSGNGERVTIESISTHIPDETSTENDDVYPEKTSPGAATNTGTESRIETYVMSSTGREITDGSTKEHSSVANMITRQSTSTGEEIWKLNNSSYMEESGGMQDY